MTDWDKKTCQVQKYLDRQTVLGCVALYSTSVCNEVIRMIYTHLLFITSSFTCIIKSCGCRLIDLMKQLAHASSALRIISSAFIFFICHEIRKKQPVTLLSHWLSHCSSVRCPITLESMKMEGKCLNLLNIQCNILVRALN